MANPNPILEEAKRLARQDKIVKGLTPAEGNKPPTFRIEFTLADGSHGPFFVDASSNRQFERWFKQAFKNLLKQDPPSGSRGFSRRDNR